MRYLLLVFITAVMFSCTNSPEEKGQTPFYGGVHFTSENAIQPIGIVKDNEKYELVYSDGQTWRIAVSDNLMYWSDSTAIDIPGSAVGDIILDTNNSLGLEGTEKTMVIVYNDGEVKMKYSQDRGKSWEDLEPGLPPNSKGNPKLSYNQTDGNWLMTLTEGPLVSVIQSRDLINWSGTAEITLESPSEWSEMVYLNGSYLLVTSDPSISFLFNEAFEQVRSFTNWIRPTKAATLSVVDTRTLLTTTIGDHLLTIPMEVTGIEDNALMLNPVTEITQVALSKKRSKLSSLKGQGPSIFEFIIENEGP